MDYVNLEPNHEVRPDDEGNLAVICPFEVVDGHITLHSEPVMQTALWAREADPGEVECPVCEVLNGQLHYLGSPDCVDTGENDEL